MRLWHRREEGHRLGRLAASDEEDCYTQAGRLRGIWLTSESLSGAGVVTVQLPSSVLRPFETTTEGDPHRTFVVPIKVLADESKGDGQVAGAVAPHGGA